MIEPNKSIYWHQGLFLQPHHLQQSDLYSRSVAAPLFHYQSPFFWGVNQLDIQETSLQDRVFELSQVETIFQDGTWIKFPGNAV
ncbi:MAG: type VI secretion system baseplate subunit TssK, partial [Desulfobulbaceae bacterium]|nr:type VI secretion system baseplate subunit TssK [Desulfobulbaceae bacterium]